MGLASFEDLLLSVVLRDSGVTFVDSEDSVRTDVDAMVEEVKGFLVFESFATPAMETGRQQHRLAAVQSVAELALFHRDNRSVAVGDAIVVHHGYRCSHTSNKRRENVVKARRGEKKIVLVVTE
jgi:hypothetical protein